MSRTAEGGSAPRQVAAIRGRQLIRERDEREKLERKRKEEAKPPSLRMGPLLGAKRS